MSSSPQATGFASVVRLSAFRHLWLSQLLALTAQNGIHFVQLVLIERLTGRTLHNALMIAAFSLPPVIFAFLAGVVIDRVPKKWIIVFSNVIRGCLALSYIFLLNWLEGDVLLVAVYVVTFLGSSVGAFFNPAVLAKIPLVVGEERLMVANSMFNLTIAGSQMLGLLVLAPAAVKVFGLSGSFALMGAFYLLAFFLVLRLPRDATRRVQGVTAASGWRRMLREVKEGWTYVVRVKPVLMAVLQLTLVATLLMIVAMIAPGFSSRVLGLAPEDAVLVFAPAGLGMVIAIFILGRWGSRVNQDWAQVAMLALTGASFAVLGFISRDYTALRIPILDVYPQRLFPLSSLVALTAFPLGFALYSVNTIAQTTVQRMTPARLRGRVFTVQFMLTYLVGLVPVLAAASLADIIGIPAMLYWLAIGCVAVGVLSIYVAVRSHSEQASSLEEIPSEIIEK